ncbi:MAG: cupin domain-containing protein [Bacteroidales bacterium]
MKTFYREDETPIKDVPNAGKLAEGTDYMLIRLILKPGEAQSLHRNQHRVIFYVMSGKGLLLVEGRTFQLGTGDGAEVMTYELRAWKNIGDVDLELLVFKFL